MSDQSAPDAPDTTTVVPDAEATREAAGTTPPRWRRYVAVGDSFTEGLWDPYPYDDGTLAPSGTESDAKQRGWADRLADTLSARRVAAGLAPLEYANLAIRGRLLRHILDEQVPAALAAEPDLVSLVGGGNDILRPKADPDVLAARLEDAVVEIRATGADVLLATGFRAGGALSVTRGRTGQYNANVWSVARRHGAYVLDLWGMRSLFDYQVWSDDRIHLTSEGHRRVSQAALDALGLEPDDVAYDELLEPRPPQRFVAKAREDVRWLRAHAVPWVRRRLQGTSSGDGRTAKWPTPGAWPPA
nr:SGNH/GDSL hydrolase family protein [Isoptericola variabilis]